MYKHGTEAKEKKEMTELMCILAQLNLTGLIQDVNDFEITPLTYNCINKSIGRYNNKGKFKMCIKYFYETNNKNSPNLYRKEIIRRP